MSQDLNQGTKYLRISLQVYENAKELFKCIKEYYQDAKDFKQFAEAIQSTKGCDPNNPSLNDDTAAFYDTKGFSIVEKDPETGKLTEYVGAEAMDRVLKAAGIPHATFTVDGRGTTVVAVPKTKGYVEQANQLFAAARINAVGKSDIAKAQLPTLQRLLSNATQQPAQSVVAALASGPKNVKCITCDSARYAALSERMEKAGIPHAITKEGENYNICYDSIYHEQVSAIDKELLRENPPLELSYTEFMQANAGKPIVVQQGLTPAQAQYLRTELAGSCLGYNLERRTNGSDGVTYTLRYNADQARIVEPVYMQSVMRSNSVNAKAINEHTTDIALQCERAQENLQLGNKQMIVDAANPDKFFMVTDKGFQDSTGRLIIGRHDEKFAPTVQATIMRMKEPLVRATDKDPQHVTDVFTKEEISKAATAHASAHPTEAEVVASKLLSLKVQSSLTAHNGPTAEYVNEVNNFCKTLSHMASESSHKFSADEVARLTGLHNGANSTPDLASQMAEQLNQMNDAERKSFVEAMSHMATTKRTVDIHDARLDEQGMRTLGKALEAQPQERQPQRDTRTRGMGHDANGDGVHQAHEEVGGEGLSEDYHRDEDDNLLDEDVLNIDG